MPPLHPARPVTVLNALILSLVFAGCEQRGAEECIVPDVVGFSLSEAASVITDTGLTVDTPSLQHSDTVPVDHVIDQTPAGGETVPGAMPISLVISLGPSAPNSNKASPGNGNQRGSP